MRSDTLKSFTVSFFNNTSESFKIQETSVMMGEWCEGDRPREGRLVRSCNVGGPWQVVTDEEQMGTGALVVLQGDAGSEVVITWLQMPDGKVEVQLGQEGFEVSQDQVDEIWDEHHLLWRFSLNESL